MGRVRISTTVNSDALEAARALGLGADSVTMDAALNALLSSHRASEIDASYVAYDVLPLDEPDEWGSVESFRESLHNARGRRPRRAS